MRLACREDFEEEGGLYWPPFSDYGHHRARAELLADRVPGGRVLIVGCAWGHTVRHCLDLGLDAWGMDASDYALANCVVPGRVVKGDATCECPDGPWDLIATEDMMPMLDQGEIVAAKDNLAQYGPVLHWVTPAPPEPHPSIQTVLSGDEWAALLAPQEVLLVGVA